MAAAISGVGEQGYEVATRTPDSNMPRTMAEFPISISEKPSGRVSTSPNRFMRFLPVCAPAWPGPASSYLDDDQGAGCFLAALDRFGVRRQCRLGPFEEPLCVDFAHVDAAVAHRMAEIVVPVCAMKRIPLVEVLRVEHVGKIVVWP